MHRPRREEGEGGKRRRTRVRERLSERARERGCEEIRACERRTKGGLDGERGRGERERRKRKVGECKDEGEEPSVPAAVSRGSGEDESQGRDSRRFSFDRCILARRRSIFTSKYIIIFSFSLSLLALPEHSHRGNLTLEREREIQN